jgi:hypothetical protein
VFNLTAFLVELKESSKNSFKFQYQKSTAKYLFIQKNESFLLNSILKHDSSRRKTSFSDDKYWQDKIQAIQFWPDSTPTVVGLPDLRGKHSDLRKHGDLILTLNYLSQSNSFSGFSYCDCVGLKL